MKTPEEIRLAVLKECGRRVDADDTTIIVGERPVWLYACNHLIDENGKLKLILVSTEKDSWEKGYTINSLGMNIHLWSGATDQEWDFAYRLLNIEAKEIEERVKGLVDALEAFMGLSVSTSTQTKFNEYVKVAKQGKEALNQWKGGGNGI